MTDDFGAYPKALRLAGHDLDKHRTVNHSAGIYVEGIQHNQRNRIRIQPLQSKRPAFPSFLGAVQGRTLPHGSPRGFEFRASCSQMAIGIGEASDRSVDAGAWCECGRGGACARLEREPGVQVAPCV